MPLCKSIDEAVECLDSGRTLRHMNHSAFFDVEPGNHEQNVKLCSSPTFAYQFYYPLYFSVAIKENV